MIGLDFDGVVVDLRYLKERLGKQYLTEEDLVSASLQDLPPVEGVDDVFRLGVVEAIVTRRKFYEPVERWFRYWFGRVVVPVHCLEWMSSKASKCKELGIKVFVDDDYFTVIDLLANGISALWFDVRWQRNLYDFLVEEGVLD